MEIEKEPFYRMPKSLFRLMAEGEISIKTLMIYIVFLERNRITKFKDEKGNKYFIFTYEQIMDEIGIKSKTTIKKAIEELISLNLLKKAGKTRQANRYYLL